jgi:hypothetical protein
MVNDYSIHFLENEFGIIKKEDDIVEYIINVAIKKLEDKKNEILENLKGWDVEEYVNYNEEWKEWKFRVQQINKTLEILKK